MAGCSEVDRSVNALPSGGKGGGEPCSGPSGTALTVPECAICLQTCVHPVRLPCRHVFCFLCAKGASWQSKRCALCRQELPEDFLERPALLSPEELRVAGRGHGEYAWYYEGRNGWWQYDERTSRELEDAFARGKKSTEMLIAGFLYVADLENMVQYRRNEHGRRRRMKRDVADIPKKGVAGLRLEADAGGPRESSADGADTASPGLTPAQSRPPAPSTSLESSFAQLQISQQSEQGQVRDREEEEEQEEEEEEGLEPTSPPSPESSAQNTSVDESLSGSNSEGEDEEEEEGPEEGTRTRQRLVEQVLPRESQMDRAPPGGESSSSSSRRPDGQCTVTEV